MEKYREWLMPFWFFWFALGGIAFTSLFAVLTEGIRSFDDIITTGAFVGIVVGGLVALVLYFFNSKKMGR